MPVTQRFIYLEQGDLAEISAAKQCTIYNRRPSREVEREVHVKQRAGTADAAVEAWRVPALHAQGDLRAARVRMADTLYGRHRRISRVVPEESLGPRRGANLLEKRANTGPHRRLRHELSRRHASASTGSRDIGGVPCQVEIASEYRYRHTGGVPPNTLFMTHIAVRRDGGYARSTALCSRAGLRLPGFTRRSCNSAAEHRWSANRTSCMMTQAGPEIGVASTTKAFTTQLTFHLLLVVADAGTPFRGLEEEKEKESSLPSIVRAAAPTCADKALQIERSA